MNNGLLAFFTSGLSFLYLFFGQINHPLEKNKHLKKTTSLLQQEVGSKRELSSEQNPADKNICLPHKPQLARLKNDIFAHEQERNKLVNISFKNEKWRNIDLEKMPPIMAFALSKNGHLLTDEINFDQCQDLICIYNTIYDDETKLTGHILYWFYLKTGYFVTATRDHPRIIIPSNEKLENIIFQKHEIAHFWTIGNSLPTSMTFLPTLKWFYRGPYHPQGYSLRSIEEGKEKSFTYSALASTEGWIFFVDSCLNNQSYRNKDLGPILGLEELSTECFYHELTHHQDFSAGNYHKIATKRPSEKAPWQSLSGWKIIEEEKDGIIYYQWERSPEASFVTQYAKTSPIEDYADSWTYSRIFPNHTAKNHPQKFSYFKENFNLSYLNQGIFEQYQNFIDKGHLARASDLVNKCTLSQREDDSIGVGPEYQRCLQQVKKEETSNLISQIKSHFWEGCQFLSNKENENKLRMYSEAKLETLMSQVLSLNPRLKETLLSSKKLRQSIQESLDSGAVIMYCHNLKFNDQKLIEKCFIDTIKEQISLLGESDDQKVSLEVINYEVEKYLELNSFKEAQDKIFNLVQKHLRSLELDSSSHIKSLIDQCMKEENGANSKDMMTPYTGKDQFIAKDFLSCLNKNQSPILKKMVTTTINKQELEEYHLTFYIDQLRPSFLNELHNEIKMKASLEQIWIKEQFLEIKNNIYELLNKKYYSAQGGFNNECINDQSTIEVLNNIIISKNPNNRLFFHTVQEWNSNVTKEICLLISNQNKTSENFPSEDSINPRKKTLSKNLDIKFISVKIIQDLLNQTTDSEMAQINRCSILFTNQFFNKFAPSSTLREQCEIDFVKGIFSSKLPSCLNELKDNKSCQEALNKIRKDIFNNSSLNHFKKLMLKQEKVSSASIDLQRAISQCLKKKAHESEKSVPILELAKIFDSELEKNNYFHECLAQQIWQEGPDLLSQLNNILKAPLAIEQAKKDWDLLDNKKKWESTRENLHSRAKIIFKQKGFNTKLKCKNGWKTVEAELKIYFKNSWENRWYQEKEVFKILNSEKDYLINDYLKR